MTDFLADKRREIVKRLAELEPLVAEYRRVEEASAALAGLPAPTGATTSTNGRKRGPGRPRGSKSTKPASSVPAAKSGRKAGAKGSGGVKRPGRRKGSGSRAAQALAFVGEQPGITVPELANKMGTAATYLYKVLPSLERDEQIRREGRRWYPREPTPAAA